MTGKTAIGAEVRMDGGLFLLNQRPIVAVAAGVANYDVTIRSSLGEQDTEIGR